MNEIKKYPLWHKIGTNIEQAVSWSEAVIIAKLDWEVEKRQLYDDKHRLVRAYGIFRKDTDEFINPVGAGYQPFQNKNCFDWSDMLIQRENGMHYVSAGALGNGHTIWSIATINDCITIHQTNEIYSVYLLFTDYRKQGKSAISKIIARRPINETVIVRPTTNDLFRIIHNQKFEKKLELSKKALTDTTLDIRSLEIKLNFLATRKLSNDLMNNIFNNIFQENSTRRDNKVNKIKNLYEKDGNLFPQVKDTVYNLFNAITSYIDNEQKPRIRKNSFLNLEQAQAESSLFGSSNKIKSDVLDTIYRMAQ